MNELQPTPAEISGQAGVIKAQPVIVTATIQVTRAASGKVEEYTLTGTAEPEQPKEPK